MTENKLLKLLQTRNLLVGNSYSSEMNEENLKYILNEQVGDCQFTLYIKVIGWINDGLNQEEIIEKLDELDLESYKKLTKDQQEFIKDDIDNILTQRKQRNERK